LAALRWSRRLYRFGRSVVRLEAGSASVGRRLKRTLTIPRPLPPGTAVQLELTCTRTSSSNMTGIDRSFRFRKEFDKEEDIDSKTSLDPIGTIPLEFEIPDDATPTTPTRQIGSFRIRHVWSLSAASITPGVDYWVKFVIPIAAA
jgi:hypothetical protein